MLRSEGSETNRQTLPENSLFLSDEKTETNRTDRKTGDFCHRGRFIRMVRYKFLMIGFHFFLHFPVLLFKVSRTLF